MSSDAIYSDCPSFSLPLVVNFIYRVHWQISLALSLMYCYWCVCRNCFCVVDVANGSSKVGDLEKTQGHLRELHVQS